MTNHNNNGMSESEETYLITIARLVEQGVEDPVAISPLAEALSILPVSANQMVHKLAEEGWLEYLPSGKQTLRRRAIRRSCRDGGQLSGLDVAKLPGHEATR